VETYHYKKCTRKQELKADTSSVETLYSDAINAIPTGKGVTDNDFPRDIA